MASNHFPVQTLHPFVLSLVATHLVQRSPAASASSSVWCSGNTAVLRTLPLALTMTLSVVSAMALLLSKSIN